MLVPYPADDGPDSFVKTYLMGDGYNLHSYPISDGYNPRSLFRYVHTV